MNDKLLKIYALADAISHGSITYKTDAKEIKKLLEEYANECGGEIVRYVPYYPYYAPYRYYPTYPMVTYTNTTDGPSYSITTTSKVDV